MTSPYDVVLRALEAKRCITKQPGPTKSEVLCPAHDDKNPSLGVRMVEDRVLLTCRAGCPTEKVVEVLGLTMADLYVNQKAGKFPDGRRHETPVSSLVVSRGSSAGSGRPTTMSNGARADSTDLTPGYRGSDGAVTPPRREVCAYPYADADGEVLFEVVRYEPKTFRQRRPGPNGTHIYNLAGIDEPPLYRLPAVISAVSAGTIVWVVEGEKDADALAAKGFVATCNPMGAGKWRPWHTRALEGAAEVRIVADDDDTGRAHASTVARALTAAGVPVSVWLPAEGCKDMSDHLRAKKTRDDLRPINPAEWGTAEAEGVEDVDDPGSEPSPAPELATWQLDWTTAWSGEHHDEDWLLEPVFAAGRAHVIWAGAKTGKSYVTLWLAAAMATGRGALRQPPGPPRHVIYIDYEMTTGDVIQRLEEYGYGPDDDLSHLHYILIPTIGGLDTRDGGMAVLAATQQWGAEFVFIDTISRAVEGEENSADTIRAFYRHTGGPLKGAGVGWCRLDHGGKDPAKGQRGTSAKNDDVDVVWKMSRYDGGVVLDATHRRMSWIPERPVKLTRREDPHISFHLADGPAWPAGTAGLAEDIRRLGLEFESARAVKEALRDAGVTFNNNVLTAARKFVQMHPGP